MTDMSESSKVFDVAGGEIAVWLEDAGCVCLKSKNKYNDPVELSEDEALELARILVELVEEMRR